MTKHNAYWQAVVEALQDRGFRFRVKWSGNEEMTAWQPWLICPVPGYVETGSLGPVSIREVEWLDVSFHDRAGADQSDSIIAVLGAACIPFSKTPDSIRIAMCSG